MNRTATQLFLAVSCAFVVAQHAAPACARPAWQADKPDFMGPDAARAKMRLVVQEAIRQTHSNRDKMSFQSGRVFVNLLEKDTAMVGVAIPSSAGGNQIIVSFAADHFQATPIDALAKEALEDFARAVQATPTAKPEWCQKLPHPENAALERVLPTEPWFEVYKVAPGVFAIYEPHQSEEVISYLIVGHKQALLFDTGMGIADIRKVVSRLTSRPVVVLNSHSHDDHVGGNWQFDFVYGMDTAFTRERAKGSTEDAKAEIAPGEICGELPKGFNPKTYVTKPWKVSRFIHDGFKINLGGRTLEIIATAGHTPDAISLLDRENGLLFTGDTYYPAAIWIYRPETDLVAYRASIVKLAELAPQIKMVLGAHNIPIAKPDVLTRLVTAFDTVQAGKVQPEPAGAGKVTYKVDDITFLMKAPESKP